MKSRKSPVSRSKTNRKSNRRAIPFDFVLEALKSIRPYTKPMFGCTAVYAEEKILFILRDRENSPEDKGVWIATTPEHHPSLQKDFPSMRSLKIFGPGPTGWQVLPLESEDFEEATLKACALVISGDHRIGKIPKARRPKSRSKNSKK